MSPSPGNMKRHRSASSTDELVHLSKSVASTSGQPHSDQNRVKKPRTQIAEVERVSQWLEELSVNDQEPGEFYQEKHHVDEFTRRHPAYLEAAVNWPKYAEVYWDGLRSSVYALFTRDPKKGDYVFVQWALAYLRSTFPKSFDLTIGSPQNIIALTDALCDGSLSPLCMAATLGLPKLCDTLASNQDQTDSTLITTFGSPLYCALLGKAFFVITRQPESWKDFLLNEEFLNAPYRTPIISRLLQMEPTRIFETSRTSPRAFRPTWRNGRPIPLMGLAFIIALKEKDLTPFAAMALDHLQVDDSFVNLFHPTNKHWWPHSSPRFRASLYTFVYDLTIRYAALFEVVDKLLQVQSVVLRCMKDDGLDFNVTDPTPIMRLKDEKFEEVVRCALLDESDIAVLQRLALDPRFNPNLDMGEDSEGGLLLHHAVSGDQPDVVDFLIKHGADLEGRDVHGRTPLMVVESPEMLSKLIETYHANTRSTDHLGSTVWHIFAATNEVGFIWALEETDPHKWENLKSVNRTGNTPFAEALRSESAWGQDGPRHHVAQILLGYNIDGDCMRSSEPLAHLAVATSDCSIIRKVYTKGTAFDGFDDKGNSPLHKINLAFADTDTVSLVAALSCEGVLENSKGYTAPEVVFANYVKRYGLELNTEFSTSAFMLLLTDKAVRHINARGQCLWERFWQATGSKVRRYTYCGETPGKLFLMGLRCLVSVGALKNYEERTGRSGMFVMRISGYEDSNEDFEDWPLSWYASSIQEFPKHGSTKLLDEFYSSLSGRFLFVRALQENMLCIGHLFCESGMTAYYPDDAVQTGCRLNDTIIVSLQHSVENHLIVEMFLHFMKPARWDPCTYKMHFFESAWAEGRPSEQKELLAMYARAGLPVSSLAKVEESSNTNAEAGAEQ